MEIQNQNDIVARGIALHKMIRLLTISLGGDVITYNIGISWVYGE